MSDETTTKLIELNERMVELLATLKEKEVSSETPGEEMHEKTPATAHTGIVLHGNGGVFSTPGLSRDVISAHVRPFGIGSKLDMFPSVDEDPRFGSVTGFTDDVGAEPATVCADAPTGYIKGCNLSARFGLIRRDTNTIDFDKVMRKLNRGDFTDLVLHGRLLGLSKLEPSGLNEGQVLDIVTMAEMVSVGVRTERKLNKQIWQGSVLVANEFPGLDVQIATGQKDADTAVLCPALDSDVKSYGYALLSSTIVEYLSMIELYLKYNAMTMGLDPVQWVVVMRPELWYELTAIWPCAYHTSKCSPAVATNSTVYIDGRENTNERDAMRQGLYIDINGSRYPVVLDTGIFEHNNINNANCKAGEYASTIYFVPLTINGSFPVTYREYLDYRKGAADVALANGKEAFFWTDNGSYSWAFEQIKWCYKYALKTEQRVILRAPHLAGRIDAVKYQPLQHLRSDDPTSPYFKDGGVSIRGGLNLPYAVWSGR